jgi:hypothetical protein
VWCPFVVLMDPICPYMCMPSSTNMGMVKK